MDIQKLTENYRKRFDAFYGQDAAENSGRKKKETPPERPNFLAEVIRPVLDALVDLMPGYGFSKTTDQYTMYGDYYRVKAGVVLVGGLSVDEDFGLFFTPLFHGAPCGEGQKITDSRQLVDVLRGEFEKREVKRKDGEPLTGREHEQ